MPQSKVFTGVLWAAVQRFGTMIISFIANIVLARLLTPDDFGTVGMLLFFLAIANVFVDSGFGSALIQKKDANDKDCSTVFVINIIMSTTLYAILFFSAPYIARFYDVPLLKPILRVQGLVLFINAFTIVQSTLLRKKLDFKKLSIANITGNIVGTVVAIVMAALGCGVWSLVARGLIVSSVVSALLWGMSDWKASLLFDKASFTGLFNFGGFILLSRIITTVSQNVQTMIIGKMFSSNDLGNYTQAKNLENICSDSVSSIICQVLYPTFSNCQDDNNQIADKLNFSTYVIAYTIAPLMGLAIVLAPQIITFLYGVKWVGCIMPFRILCFGGLFLSLQDINYYVIAAKGKSRLLLYLNTLILLLKLGLIILGGHFYGLLGLLWACVAGMFFGYIIYSVAAIKNTKQIALKQYWYCFLCFIINLIIGLLAYWLFGLIYCFIPEFLAVILVGIFYVSIYTLLSLIFNMAPFMYIIGSIKSLITSRR